MATEIGRLVSIFEADTRKFDAALKASEERIKSLKANIASIKTDDIGFKPQRLAGLNDLLKKATAEHKALSAAQKEAAASAKQMGQDMSAALSTVAPRLAGLVGMAGPLAALAAGLVAVGGAAAGIFELTRSVSEATGKFVDLSQQVGFSVETLSALSNAAETSGGSINTVVGALGIFERNMVEAQDSTTEMSRLFKQLSIDTKDNEKALRQSLEQLSKLPPGAERTALAMKLFGRSGREVAAIMDEMGGTLDDFMDKLRVAGVLIGTDTARAGDKLSDSLIEMNRQFESVKRMVAEEFAPVVLRAITSLTDIIETNKGTIRGWISDFDAAARGAGVLANAISTLGGLITGLNNLPIPSVLQFLASFSGVGGIYSGLQALGRAQGGGGPMSAQFRSLGRPNFSGRPASIGAPNFSPFRPASLGAPRGGGGGGRGGGRAQTDPGLQYLKQLEDQYKSLTPQTELQKVQDKLLEEQYRKTSDAIKKRVMATAIEIDAQKKILEITRERFVTEESFARFRDQELIDSITRVRQLLKLERERFATEAGRNRPGWQDLGGGSTLVQGGTGDTRPRIATVDEQVRREQFEIIRQQAESLASDLTGIFDRALYDGISGGAKKGLQSLALGFLDMIQQIILGKLKTALADALSGGGGGGGFIGGLIRAVVGGAIGGAAGGVGGGTHGGGTIGTGGKVFGRASGGPMYAGSPYLVGERGPEWVIPNQNAMVLPHGRQPGNNITINIAIPPETKGSYNPKLSARQQAEMFAAAIQSRLR